MRSCWPRLVPEKAVAAQEIITEERPKDSTFATLAVLAYQAGRPAEAAVLLQTAVTLQPGVAGALSNLGAVLLVLLGTGVMSAT